MEAAVGLIIWGAILYMIIRLVSKIRKGNRVNATANSEAASEGGKSQAGASAGVGGINIHIHVGSGASISTNDDDDLHYFIHDDNDLAAVPVFPTGELRDTRPTDNLGIRSLPIGTGNFENASRGISRNGNRAGSRRSRSSNLSVEVSE